MIKRAISFSPEICFDVKTNYVFQLVFNDDLLHLLCITLPQTAQEFFDSTLIDMQVDQTKDRLGSFVERYIPLFVGEIKYFINTYADELKYRIQKQD